MVERNSAQIDTPLSVGVDAHGGLSSPVGLTLRIIQLILEMIQLTLRIIQLISEIIQLVSESIQLMLETIRLTSLRDPIDLRDHSFGLGDHSIDLTV